MSISRIKPFNWAVNEKLTSAQINQIDTSLTYALDKRDGYADSLGSDVTVNSSGSFIFASGSSLVANSGSFTTFYGTTAVASGGTFSASAGSVVSLAGAVNISGGTTISGATTLSNTVSLTGATTASNFTLSNTNRVKLASRSATRVWDGHFVPDPNTNWRISSGAWRTSTTATLQVLSCALDLPHNAVLTSIIVYVQGGSGHGSLPTSMPILDFIRVTVATGATSSASATDSSATVGVYEAVHNITYTPAPGYTIDRDTYKYVVALTSESDASTIAGFKVFGIKANYTVTEMDDFR